MPSEFVGVGEPLSQTGLAAVLAHLDIGAPAIWSVLAVETSGCGFLPDRRPKILFERHIFHKETGGRFDAVAPDLSNATTGGYGASGGHQYDRLARAIGLDRIAALKSASWGLAQIMGLNAESAGFADVESMVGAMVASEDAHLMAMAKFIENSEIDDALRNHDWDTFAATYNGPNYQANDYAGKLRRCFHQYSIQLPDLLVRTAQVLLTYVGENPGDIDGILGNRTRAALGSAGAPHLDRFDRSTIDFLKAKVAQITPEASEPD